MPASGSAGAAPPGLDRYGLFRSPQEERNFLHGEWAEIAPRAHAIGLWGGAFFAAGLLADLLIPGASGRWPALLLVRALVCACGLGLARATGAHSRPDARRLRQWLLAFEVAVLLGLRAVAQLHHMLSPDQVIAAVFACVVLYAYAPLLRPLQFHWMPLWVALSALQMRWGLGAAWRDVALFVLLLSMLQFIGWQLAAHGNRAQRLAWLARGRLQREIAERVAAEENLRHLFEVSPVPLVLVGRPRGQLLRLNPAARELLDPQRLLPEPALAKAESFYAQPQTAQMLAQALARQAAAGPLDVQLRDSGGRVLDVMLSARKLRYDGRRAVLASLVEITHRKRQEHELQRMAHSDPLTALYNRRGFFALCARLRHSRDNLPLALLALDIDHFKQINDNHGHAIGDIVLQQLAGRLAALLREPDVLGRIGGEEFAAMLPATSAPQALELAEGMRRAVGEHALRCHGLRLHLSVSIGVTLITRDDDDIDSALARADAALYRAKREGRNQVRWQPDPGAA